MRFSCRQMKPVVKLTSLVEESFSFTIKSTANMKQRQLQLQYMIVARGGAFLQFSCVTQRTLSVCLFFSGGSIFCAVCFCFVEVLTELQPVGLTFDLAC